MSPGGCYETQFLGLFWDLAHGLFFVTPPLFLATKVAISFVYCLPKTIKCTQKTKIEKKFTGIDQSSERMLFPISYLQLALAHARNSRVKNRIRLHDLIVVQKRPLGFCIIKELGTKHFYEILIWEEDSAEYFNMVRGLSLFPKRYVFKQKEILVDGQ